MYTILFYFKYLYVVYVVEVGGNHPFLFLIISSLHTSLPLACKQIPYLPY